MSPRPIASLILVLSLAAAACTTAEPEDRPTQTLAPVRSVTSESVRVAFVGDTGTGDDGQRLVASLIAEVDNDDLDALVLLGDMIYEEGDPTLIDERVTEPYELVLDGATQLVPVLGNHDVRSGHGDLIMATLGAPGRWYSVELGPITLIVLDSTRPQDQQQQQFIRSALAEYTTRWTIVALHHPPYSAGFHGSDAEIQEAFVPMFEEFGVDLVFGGHDHDYQRTLPINGVTYVVSGGGARTRPTGMDDFSVVSHSVLNFVLVTATEDQLSMTVHGNDGQIDQFQLP